MADINKPVFGTVWAGLGEKLPPAEAKIKSGWIREMMPYQYQNYLQNRVDNAITYLLQKGVAEWSADQEYIANKSVVTYSGQLYMATATVTNVLPTVTTSWKKLTVTFGTNGAIPITLGGTGATNAADARTNLGIGSAATVNLPASNGVVVKLADNSLVARSLTGTTGYITVTNPDGVSGNPTINVGANVAKTDADAAWTTKTSIKLPAGTTSERGLGVPGRIRFNMETGVYEGHDNVGWNPIGSNGVMDVQNFVGDGTTTAFTLSSNPRAENNTQVYFNGVYQQKNSYSLSGQVLTFDEAPAPDIAIEVVTITSVAIGTTTAAQTSIVDSGNYYNSTNVEGALQEIGDKFNSTTSSVGSISSLRDIDKDKHSSVFVLGYWTTGDGGGGLYCLRHYVAPSDWDNGGSQITAADGAGWELQISNGEVSVLQFGAKGDGATNDTSAITAADTAAGLAKLLLVFPSRTFMINPMEATASWLGKPGSLIKSLSTASTFNSVVTWSNRSNFSVTGLICDGNVSADPAGGWNSSNFDSFTGSQGFNFQWCSDYVVMNCVAQNCKSSGFRDYEANRAVYINCRTNRTRGRYGDGFYCDLSKLVIREACVAYDFTRIGYVTDRSAATGGSYNVQYSNCRAEYGHDSSVLYGGIEYNAGFWSEFSAQIKHSQCHVKNTTHYGFVSTSGSGMSLTESHAVFRYTDCTANTTQIGFVGQGLGGSPVDTVYQGCMSFDANHGFGIYPNSSADTFTLGACFSQIDFARHTSYVAGIAIVAPVALINKPKVTIDNYRFTYKNKSQAQLDSLTSYTATIGCFAVNNLVNLTIRDVRSTTDGEEATIKIGDSGGFPSVTVHDSRIRFVYSDYVGDLMLQNCTLAAASSVAEAGNGNTLITDSIVNLSGITKIGGNTIKLSNVRAVSGSATSDYLWLLPGGTYSSKYPSIRINDFTLEKNISEGGYGLRLGFGTADYSTIFESGIYYNSGAATSTNPFVAHATSMSLYATGVIADSSVTYFTGIDSGGGLAVLTGVTNVALH